MKAPRKGEDGRRPGRGDSLSPQALIGRFAGEGFVLSRPAARALALADALEKPLLLEGPPGVGKTEIARLWALATGSPLVRLQCYEGLDEARALYEWSYGKQILYSQLLREKVGEVLGGAPSLEEAVARLKGQADVFFSMDFLLPRPLMRALLSPERAVLLVDEIDRSDEEFEAFLLEMLQDFQVSVPELGTVKAVHRPRVVLTSNDSRDLADALRRRCLYLYIDYPSVEEEAAILALRAPGLPEALRRQLAAFVGRLRRAGLRKAPGVAEAIDWALALAAVGAEDLGRPALEETLGALLKHREDLKQVLDNLATLRPPAV
ncbi:MAG: MoxR family ATPase [Candidatus Tectomicrobia bacterium]|uniref:MoxR family ATPase n=1 Tax=Tectimicrobiota bacterium TaxID=2528274 RepID=A0A932MPJ4_UNCTE|nr:MoxR family ATPase [Candidatus Tectomicrobia bacterium]